METAFLKWLGSDTLLLFSTETAQLRWVTTENLQLHQSTAALPHLDFFASASLLNSIVVFVNLSS